MGVTDMTHHIDDVVSQLIRYLRKILLFEFVSEVLRELNLLEIWSGFKFLHATGLTRETKIAINCSGGA
jgi:hypothetical protein